MLAVRGAEESIMPSTWKVQLPAQTKVYVYGYTNAAHQQKVRLTLKNGTVLTFTGTGENNTPTAPPSATFTTPADLNYHVVIDISCMTNGNWTPSLVKGAGTYLQAAVVYVVSSDDTARDGEFNDSCLVMMWYNPVAST
jgi:hypothetical protein